MPEYNWSARTTAGVIQKGEMNEVNESVVSNQAPKNELYRYQGLEETKGSF